MVFLLWKRPCCLTVVMDASLEGLVGLINLGCVALGRGV